MQWSVIILVAAMGFTACDAPSSDGGGSTSDATVETRQQDVVEVYETPRGNLEVSWSLSSDPELNCALAGITTIAVRALQAGEEVASQSTPCSGYEGLMLLPSLPVGIYDIEVFGVTLEGTKRYHGTRTQSVRAEETMRVEVRVGLAPVRLHVSWSIAGSSCIESGAATVDVVVYHKADFAPSVAATSEAPCEETTLLVELSVPYRPYKVLAYARNASGALVAKGASDFLQGDSGEDVEADFNLVLCESEPAACQ